ncbi:glycosyltransferase [Alteraurantiacibacter aquimixticola]|uniref:Glycosyltransferase n=1 Tax=Alteraurantiacibacter aquimixticola TaxID=2489173 RepID=A0A4T3F461_9SPHN|nr:glycosyltransferase [Alteraurantiacibacter aquimixticola]TIX51104.1 glycosyltransferase [Alteraurantiacibacter aquimixticola]
MRISIVIPMLNEEKALPQLAEVLGRLDPAPFEVLCVDGGSEDGSVGLAESYGWRVVNSARGRGLQINTGVEAARGEAVLVLHADTYPPADAMQVIVQTLSDPRIALASFTPVIKGSEKTRWGTTAHNWAKTWYAPLLFRPLLFLRGARLLFGDHGMFFRRHQFLDVGGCDPSAKVMEEVDLCAKLVELGRVKLVPRMIETSDRRIAEWGALKANWTYLKVGFLWAMGVRERLERHYPDVR